MDNYNNLKPTVKKMNKRIILRGRCELYIPARSDKQAKKKVMQLMNYLEKSSNITMNVTVDSTDLE